MDARRVTVRVPATSANLGPGFDALGIALDITGDVTLEWTDKSAPPPPGRAEALALEAAQRVFERCGAVVPVGLSAQYVGDIPVGRGLGASAVLRVGAVVAANELLGAPLDQEQVLALACEVEGHPDNVLPALRGGFQVCVWAESGITHVRAPIPADLQAVLFVPDLDMPTSESRELLPEKLTRAEVVHNIGRAALVVAAFATGRLDVLDVATQDVLHQPARSRLFPEMFDIFAAAKSAGAHCAYLSGGGSAILAFVTAEPAAVGEAMRARAAALGRSGSVLVTRPRMEGATIISD